MGSYLSGLGSCAGVIAKKLAKHLELGPGRCCQSRILFSLSLFQQIVLAQMFSEPSVTVDGKSSFFLD